MGDFKLFGQVLQQSGLFFEVCLMQGVIDYFGQDLKVNLLCLFVQLLLLLLIGVQVLGMFVGNMVNLVQVLLVFVCNVLGNLGQSVNKIQVLNFFLLSKVFQLFDEDMELELLLCFVVVVIFCLQIYQLLSLVQISILLDGI